MQKKKKKKEKRKAIYIHALLLHLSFSSDLLQGSFQLLCSTLPSAHISGKVTQHLLAL